MKLKLFGLLLLLVLAACGAGYEEQYASIEEVEETEEVEEVTMAWQLAGFADITRPAVLGRGQIHLYGEHHGHEDMTNKQFELWHYYYRNHGMRHLFVEKPYFGAEFLNIWMQEDNDDILNMIYDEIEYLTGRDFTYARELYKRIKAEMPETIFHGTDIGHHYQTVGQWFLQHLRDNGLAGGEQYALAMGNIAQRVLFDEMGQNHSHRADMMVQNFVREFDSLDGESIMSLFYGASHLELGYYRSELGGGVTMAQQLIEIYGDRVHTTDLPRLMGLVRPQSVWVQLGQQMYGAENFGVEHIGRWNENYISREFERILNAWDDFAAHELTGIVLPHSNFPTEIRGEDVFRVVVTTRDGEEKISHFRTEEGVTWGGAPAMVEFLID